MVSVARAGLAVVSSGCWLAAYYTASAPAFLLAAAGAATTVTVLYGMATQSWYNTVFYTGRFAERLRLSVHGPPKKGESSRHPLTWIAASSSSVVLIGLAALIWGPLTVASGTSSRAGNSGPSSEAHSHSHHAPSTSEMQPSPRKMAASPEAAPDDGESRRDTQSHSSAETRAQGPDRNKADAGNVQEGPHRQERHRAHPAPDPEPPNAPVASPRPDTTTTRSPSPSKPTPEETQGTAADQDQQDDPADIDVQPRSAPPEDTTTKDPEQDSDSALDDTLDHLRDIIIWPFQLDDSGDQPTQPTQDPYEITPWKGPDSNEKEPKKNKTRPSPAETPEPIRPSGKTPDAESGENQIRGMGGEER